MYCTELKPPEKNQNNTEFLIEFNRYIDSETPNHPSCEYARASITLHATTNACDASAGSLDVGFVSLIEFFFLLLVLFKVKITSLKWVQSLPLLRPVELWDGTCVN